MWFFLDPSNKIIDVSPDWDSQAGTLGGALVARRGIVGRSLWDFVNGAETRSYLNAVFFWCRQSGRGLSLPNRCDAPNLRRECRMDIAPDSEGGLEVRHHLLAETPVAGQKLSGTDAPGQQCSQCLRWEGPDGWRDLMIATPPQATFVTYVICPDCRRAANRALGRDSNGAGGLGD